MKKLKVVVSLITQANDYQRCQASAAEDSAKRHGIDVQVIYANNSAVDQSQQLLEAIQSKSNRPDAIVVEPVGTGMLRVAQAAAAAGIGWAVLNRDVEYIYELRKTSTMPVFLVGADQEAVGQIQGRQFCALLPASGCILYIEGPSTGGVAPLRTAGMVATKLTSIDIKTLKGDWTAESAYKAVNSWRRLSTAKHLHIGVIGCQNDAMAAGARKAFEEVTDNLERSQWLSLPYTGCDGLPETGQEWVRRGVLAATVITPPSAGIAVDLLVKAIHSGAHVPERTMAAPCSYPSIEDLTRKFQRRV